MNGKALFAAAAFVLVGAGPADAKDYYLCNASSVTLCSRPPDVHLGCACLHLGCSWPADSLAKVLIIVMRTWCVTMDAATGKAIVGKYRLVNVKDVPDGDCGVHEFKITCLDD
jgi:hypothetical protein